MRPVHSARATLAAAFVSVLVAACADDAETTAAAGGGATIAAAVAPGCLAQRGGAAREREAVAVSLSGLYEVPPVNTAGSGSGNFVIDRSTGELSGSISVTGAAGAAHIHTGFAGTVGAVAVDLLTDGAVAGTFNVPAGTILGPAQLADFLAGGMYVQAHPNASGNGESRALMRGQIVPGEIDVVRCQATGDFEVPAVTTAGSGIAYLTVNTGVGAASGAYVVNVRTSGIADAERVHLHLGFAGLNGDIVQGLNQTGGAGTDFWEFSGTLAPIELSAYLGGETYLNVHTPGSPNGLVRSQFVPRNVTVLRFGLTGAQAVPPVAAAGSGIGYVTVNDANLAVAANIRTGNLAGAVGTEMRQAAAGAEGDILFALAQPDAVLAPELWAGTSIISPEQWAAFKANETYLAVLTPSFPGGELRGQVILP